MDRKDDNILTGFRRKFDGFRRNLSDLVRLGISSNEVDELGVRHFYGFRRISTVLGKIETVFDVFRPFSTSFDRFRRLSTDLARLGISSHEVDELGVRHAHEVVLQYVAETVPKARLSSRTLFEEL